MIKEIANEYLALIPAVFASFRDLNKHSEELTHMQNHVIEFIYMHQKALNLKDISAGLHIAKQQLSNIIGDLVNDGFLDKIPDNRDKRAVLVSLTLKGKELQDRKWADIYQNFSNNLAKLSEEEQIDLKFALHKVNVLVKKMEG
ncbi:MarR family winged helix-turn-helix transcriptional regulator [Paenibacillus whitsoniae]|uniref:MarR family transcriptional regulator n=1 Tax=Paenibacillus whitsoniae TaxID=2496558 RepID=A0A3S0CQQ6_9BACL|nr:MarR family transcriptional regulator [Paenibacillus whitsoniae]RTE03969.1 MarR family transcriptional regulator [Paenibacillus whitsoniae]